MRSEGLFTVDLIYILDRRVSLEADAPGTLAGVRSMCIYRRSKRKVWVLTREGSQQASGRTYICCKQIEETRYQRVQSLPPRPRLQSMLFRIEAVYSTAFAP